MPVFQACAVKHMKNDSTGASLQIFKQRKFSWAYFFLGKLFQESFSEESAGMESACLQKLCKKIDVKNRCFFSWHRIGNILRTKYCACCCEGSGGRSTSKNSKEKYCIKNLDLQRSLQHSIYKTKTANKTQLYNRLGRKAVILPSDTWDSFGNRINWWYM